MALMPRNAFDSGSSDTRTNLDPDLGPARPPVATGRDGEGALDEESDLQATAPAYVITRLRLIVCTTRNPSLSG